MTLEGNVLRHRLAILQRAVTLGNGSQACREFGISRTLCYRWRQRCLRDGQDGVRPRPTRPSRWPRQATPALEPAVVADALLWPTHGPARVAAHLRQPRWGGWQVSASGVDGIRCRRGLRTRWERLIRREAHSAATVGLLTERTRQRLGSPHVEARQPGDGVGIDAVSSGKLQGVGQVWQLTACDAACSYAIASVVPRMPAQAAVHFLRRHVLPIYQRAGHRLRAVLTDGGPAFQTVFTAACREAGIQHRRTTPRHAWTNGFVERLPGTIRSELWRVAFRRTYHTRLEQLDRDLQAYLRFYNRERPHLGSRLKGRTPAMLFLRRQVA